MKSQGPYYHIEGKDQDKFMEIFNKPFLTDDLIRFIEINDLNIKRPVDEFVQYILLNSNIVEKAEYGKGYWTDHWFYNLDLIESYETIFPDKFKNVLLNDKTYTYYYEDYLVRPRDKKYVIKDGRVRQYLSVIKINNEPDRAFIQNINYHRVKTHNQEIFYTTLLSKLFSVFIIKFSMLDANGTDIEMESDGGD